MDTKGSSALEVGESAPEAERLGFLSEEKEAMAPGGDSLDWWGWNDADRQKICLEALRDHQILAGGVVSYRDVA